MDRQADKRPERQIGKWTDNIRTDRKRQGVMDRIGWRDRWMDGLTDRWMERQIDRWKEK
jgi:hypothetical protein